MHGHSKTLRPADQAGNEIHGSRIILTKEAKREPNDTGLDRILAENLMRIGCVTESPKRQWR
jgi:hypothetical protein